MRSLIYSALAVLLMAQVASAQPVDPGAFQQAIKQTFGGPVKLGGATAGQVPVKQADGSWQPGTPGGAPSGNAGGDLGSTYPNPTVVGLTHVTSDLVFPANKKINWNAQTFASGYTDGFVEWSATGDNSFEHDFCITSGTTSASPSVNRCLLDIEGTDTGSSATSCSLNTYGDGAAKFVPWLELGSNAATGGADQSAAGVALKTQGGRRVWITPSGTEARLSSTTALSFSSGADPKVTAADLFAWRSAANTVSFGTTGADALGTIKCANETLTGTLTLTGATVSGSPTWSNNQAITLSTAAQPNVTSLGTLTSLTMGGTLTVGANTLALASATVSGTPTWSSSQAITLSTAAQPNITSLGTLTGLTITDTSATNANVLSVTKNPVGAQSGVGVNVLMGATTTGSAIYANQTTGGSGALLQLQNNATDKFSVSNAGTTTWADAANFVVGTSTGTQIATTTSQKLGFFGQAPIANGLGLASGTTIQWNADTILSRFAAAGLLGLSDSGTATEFRTYGTTDSTTSPTNSEFFSIKTATGGGAYTIRSQATGTGTVRDVNFTPLAQTATNATGAAVTYNGGTAQGSGTGGGWTGNAGLASATGNGGAWNGGGGSGGATSGVGGAATLSGGAGTGSTSGAGGLASLVGGAGSTGSNNNAAGGFTISTGASSGSGTALGIIQVAKVAASGAAANTPVTLVSLDNTQFTIAAAGLAAVGGTAGGSIAGTAGQSATGSAGTVSWTGGLGGSTSGGGGSVSLAGGGVTTTSSGGGGGAVNLTGGGCTGTTTTGVGGAVVIAGGIGGTQQGNGGACSVTGGNGNPSGTVAAASVGGLVTIAGGNGSANSNNNASGGILINAGNSTGTGTSQIVCKVAPVAGSGVTLNTAATVLTIDPNGCVYAGLQNVTAVGNVSFTASKGGTTSGAGGNASLIAGAAGTAGGATGVVNVTGGANAIASGSTAGGQVNVTAGACSGTTSTGGGGALVMAGGAGGTTSGTGGAASLTGGAGSGSTSGAGGAASLVGGAGSTGSNNNASGGVTIGTGLSSGTGTSNINHQTSYMLASGSTAQTAGDRYKIVGKSTTLSTTTATLTQFADINLATTLTGGHGVVFYCVKATSATDIDTASGHFDFTAVNKAGTLTVTAGTITDVKASTNGSITSGVTVTASTTHVQLNVTPAFTTIAPTAVVLDWQIWWEGNPVTLTVQ